MTSFMTFVKNVNTLEIIGIHLKYQFLLKSAFWLIYDLGKLLR